MADDDVEEDGAAGAISWVLDAVASRLVPLLHMPGAVRGGAAIHWFSALATALDRARLNRMLPQLLGLLGSGRLLYADKIGVEA